MTDNKMKVVFAPGSLDGFDGTQEELDALIAEIIRLVESGELMDHAEPVTDEKLLAELLAKEKNIRQ